MVTQVGTLVAVVFARRDRERQVRDDETETPMRVTEWSVVDVRLVTAADFAAMRDGSAYVRGIEPAPRCDAIAWTEIVRDAFDTIRPHLADELARTINERIRETGGETYGIASSDVAARLDRLTVPPVE